ncbi:hypothetical protein DSO57_1034816 [Entomophthora muscae]|uniref:Uncharacterized protein n=1 Tax=Entomophthora muscae TaxID=34485 RepID=A0ACC2TAQ2_9FUNG|nr:hypothetical protein DSO57_1034816 [Entomophthora muscae]
MTDTPLGALISSAQSFSLGGPSSSASACGGLTPEKCGRAVQQSIGPAAWGNPGSGYSKTCQSPKDNSLNGHQIDANLGPSKTQTYAEVAACLNEVKTKLIFNSSNDHHQLPAFCPERVVQLNYSGDIVNSGGGITHCHFYSPEQALPGSPALETLSQDPCPASALSANLNPAKIKEAKYHGIKILATTRLPPSPETNLLNCPRHYTVPWEPPLDLYTLLNTPNPAYLEYNLETILIANPLARTRSTKFIGHKGNRVEILLLLFKDKYNYLPVYFVPMTPPLTLRPDFPLKPTAAVETTSNQLFGVL